MKIAVFGTGYVGLANAIMFAQKNEVVAVDILQSKVDLINKRVSPIVDQDIEFFFKNIPLNLVATMDPVLAVKDAEYVIIATPTDYHEDKNYFDTSSVESVMALVQQLNPNAVQIIKSTIPLGFIETQQKKGFTNVIFVPEFLREGRALYDSLHPSRIVIGENSDRAKKFVNLILDCIKLKDVPVLYTNPTEAEAVKLFSNSYLAMRVAYFNEIDNYAMLKGLDSSQIIRGVGLDPRIGSHYCNPSFGYGGYCLPKDTKQLLSNYRNIPQSIIGAIVEANALRKQLIAQMIIAKKPRLVGIYRLIMKTGSDNFRASAVQDIIKLIQKEGINVVIYEPTFKDKMFDNCTLLNNLEEFKLNVDIILANRMSEELTDVSKKVFTRDIFNND